MTAAAPLVVKICGLGSPEVVTAALAAGADMVGFVHFAPSPRHLDLEAAARFAEPARGRAEVVLLLVDADDAVVDRAMAVVRPDWLQLHGRETPERVAEVARRTGARVMKALPIGGTADVARVPAYAAVADLLLLDAKPLPGEILPGGNGHRFDWRLTQAIDRSVPFMLSGGLDPDNVGEAIEAVAPFGVDVSSGVERTRGVKDPALIAAFVAAARAAERGLARVEGVTR